MQEVLSADALCLKAWQPLFFIIKTRPAPLPVRSCVQLCQVLDAAEFCRNAHVDQDWRSAAQQVRGAGLGWLAEWLATGMSRHRSMRSMRGPQSARLSIARALASTKCPPTPPPHPRALALHAAGLHRLRGLCAAAQHPLRALHSPQPRLGPLPGRGLACSGSGRGGSRGRAGQQQRRQRAAWQCWQQQPQRGRRGLE